MKKIIIPIVIAVLVIVCAVMLINSDKEEAPEVTDGQPLTVNLEPETTKEPLFTPSVNKKVTVTLPIEFVDKKYGDDLEAFAEANGYYSIKKVGDAHVKIKMRALAYDLILSNIGMETISGIGTALDSGEYPFFTDILKYNDDFSYVAVSVNKEEYEKAEDKDIFFSHIAVYCLYYQDYCNESEGKCEIVVCEEDTNIIIETREITLEDLT